MEFQANMVDDTTAQAAKKKKKKKKKVTKKTDDLGDAGFDEDNQILLGNQALPDNDSDNNQND